MTLYVVAIKQEEAEQIAAMVGHATREKAEVHLREVQAPPTDPFYASQYKVHKVEVPSL